MTLRDQLLELQEPKYMKFTAALMPGVENVLGIRLPVLRKIARQIAAGDWRTYLAEARGFLFRGADVAGAGDRLRPLHAGRKAGACGALRAQNRQLGGLRLFLLAPEGSRTAADVGIHTAPISDPKPNTTCVSPW